MLTHLFLSINLFHPQSNSLSYNYPHFTEKENWDSEARLLGKNESYSPGDPEASPGNLASKLLTTVCASCYKVNATRDLNLSAAIFHNNFSKCYHWGVQRKVYKGSRFPIMACKSAIISRKRNFNWKKCLLQPTPNLASSHFSHYPVISRTSQRSQRRNIRCF